MKVLVCGDRNWSNREFLYERLDALHSKTPFTLVIHGGARGADTMAGDWAIFRGVPVQVFPAQWELYGRAAGPIRNQQMLDEGKPDWVIGFHNNFEKSKGTKDMIYRADRAGITNAVISKGRTAL